MLFNKDIYVIRNFFALGRCWPEKLRFLWDPTLASPGALKPAVEGTGCDLTTGKQGLWQGKRCTGSDRRRIHHGNQVPLWRDYKKCSSSVSSDVLAYFLSGVLPYCASPAPTVWHWTPETPLLIHPPPSLPVVKALEPLFRIPDYLKREKYKTEPFSTL